MILVDANLPLYAADQSSPWHAKARAWWEAKLSADDVVGMAWPTLTAFLRLATSRKIFDRPLTMGEAAEVVSGWLAQPCVRVLLPTSRHWEIFQGMLQKGQADGGLVSDAHLAALAFEYGAEIQTMDADFSRFPGIRYRNPLQD